MRIACVGFIQVKGAGPKQQLGGAGEEVKKEGRPAGFSRSKNFNGGRKEVVLWNLRLEARRKAETFQRSSGSSHVRRLNLETG